VTRLRTGRGVRVRMLASLVEVHPASGGKNAQRIAGDHRVGFAGATPVDYLGGFLLSAVRHHCACAFHLPSGLRFCSSRSKASEAPGSVHRSPRAMTTRAESTSIVPVQRVGHRQPTGIDRLARAATPEHPMLEEQLNGPPCGLAGAGVTGGRGVLLQTPRCAQRLVERRPVPAAPVVPLPAAVWPLPGDDVLGKSLGSFVGCESEPRARAERVAVDTGMRTRQPVDHPRWVPQTVDDPGQNVRSGCCDARVAGRRRELGQRDQPPMRAGPLAVRVAPEPTVLMLPRDQRRHPRPGQMSARSGTESSSSRSRRARYRTAGSTAASSQVIVSAVLVSTTAGSQITRPIGAHSLRARSDSQPKRCSSRTRRKPRHRMARIAEAGAEGRPMSPRVEDGRTRHEPIPTVRSARL
jgi:hypothetical protein